MIELGFVVGIGSVDFEILIMKELEIEDFLKLFLVNKLLKLLNILLVRVVPKSLVILFLSHELFAVFYLYQYYYVTPISNTDLIPNKRQVIVILFP